MLITAVAMPLPYAVCVNGATSAPYERTYGSTFLAPRDAADCRASKSAASDRQFISMLLPKRSMMTAVVPLARCYWRDYESERE